MNQNPVCLEFNTPQMLRDAGSRRCAATSPPQAARRLRSLCARAVVACAVLLPLGGMAQELQTAPSDAAVAATPMAAAAAVNINTASASELAAGLNGVGAARAEAIIRYRELYGPFQSVEELAEVSGIGSATVERNRPMIKLN